ncbi:MAG: hydrogenase subunit MbhD domain-containing protein [Bacteroidota bacterium]
MIQTILVILITAIMLVMAIVAIYHKNLQVAVIASGVISLFASVVYIILSAPDVAITEASIGSVLTVAIFFYILNRIRHENPEK